MKSASFLPACGIFVAHCRKRETNGTLTPRTIQKRSNHSAQYIASSTGTNKAIPATTFISSGPAGGGQTCTAKPIAAIVVTASSDLRPNCGDRVVAMAIECRSSLFWTQFASSLVLDAAFDFLTPIDRRSMGTQANKLQVFAVTIILTIAHARRARGPSQSAAFRGGCDR